jgi:hypothetical protein
LRKGAFLFGLLATVAWSCAFSFSSAIACSSLPPASSPDFLEHLTDFMNDLCYQKAHWQHDAQVRTSDGVHPFVRVWYSPQLFNWITVKNRQGPVPDGAMVVKEQFATLTAPLRGWTVMVKDSDVSWDGWYWADLENPSPRNPNKLPERPSDGSCAEPQPIFNGAGRGCVSCHASAIAQETYSSTAYLGPAHGSVRFSSSGDNEIAPFKIGESGDSEATLAPEYIERIPSSVFANLRRIPKGTAPCMITEALDHVVPKPLAKGGPSVFVTSDQCAVCHDATGTISGLTPNMIFQSQDGPVNLSQYGEWRYSMMGLAGRDPVFFAQLDTESTLHKHLVGKPDGAAFVQDLCLRCHGVMGQRQFHIDNPGRGNLFTRPMLQDADSKYGALARDGVSCAVCHHISDKGLLDPSTDTGRFILGPANVLYGPYLLPSPVTLPMANALGMQPQFALHTESSFFCASCHTIELPVYDSNGNQVVDEHGLAKSDFEQTTFLEWVNGISVAIPCQSCHMPTKYHGADLAFKIANIEDNTYPRIPETGPSTRAPDAQITMPVRGDYGRHMLNGINVFVLEMFDQFRKDLGLFKVDPNLPFSLVSQISSQKTAVAEGVLFAQTATAKVQVTSVSADSNTLVANLLVQNLAGHNFPSGVSFRRAFVDFQVLDQNFNVLWESGKTNADGVIVDNSGTPLTTEFFSATQQQFQPHFWTGSPITNDKQVQIYEELAIDPQGMLTTSFLSLDHKVKDNRIQTLGRSPSGPFAQITAPVGTGDDPSYQNGCGCSTLSYQIPMAQIAGTPVSVQATIYYQSIPPYYLRQRVEDGNGPDTARLIQFVSGLNLNNYPEIASWKLAIANSGVVSIK